MTHRFHTAPGYAHHLPVMGVGAKVKCRRCHVTYNSLAGHKCL